MYCLLGERAILDVEGRASLCISEVRMIEVRKSDIFFIDQVYFLRKNDDSKK